MESSAFQGETSQRLLHSYNTNFHIAIAIINVELTFSTYALYSLFIKCVLLMTEQNVSSRSVQNLV